MATGAGGMTAAARRRARATGPSALAVSILQSGVCLLAWGRPTANIAFAAQAVHHQQRRLMVPPQVCQEFYQAGVDTEAAVAAEAAAASVHNESQSSGVVSVMSVSSPSSTVPAFWQASDCMDVWASWTRTLPSPLEPSFPDRRRIQERAAEMRQQGSPCLVESTVKGDGVGSMTMRHLATKIFAEEVGCDWLTPDQGASGVTEGGSGASLYCHSAATYEQLEKGFKNATRDEVETMVQRCSLTNWTEYFRMSSVELPANCTLRTVEADAPNAEEDLDTALAEIDARGYESLDWDRLKIVLSRVHTSANNLASPASWDERKRETVRRVLGEFRENFHQSPRPWYNPTPECEYEPSGLNFALHVRMGDRRDIEPATPKYFSMLEDFMDTVTQEVARKGHAAPTFHVFSEALYPCPSPGNGTFDEFPTWPVERDEIHACLNAETPGDCAEKRSGAFSTCLPDRPNAFRIEGKPLVLHVGRDVTDTLSCMIHADGLLMGCSTFGQLAGVLNGDGLSFFSTECGGLGTSVQYKMMPPLAVAERGRMWVPVEGSWRDPVLTATHLLSAALDELLLSRGGSMG